MLTIFSSIRLVGSRVRAQVNLAHHHQVNYVLKSILNTGIKCWLLQMVVRVSIVGQRGRWAHVSPLRQLFSKFFWLFTKLMHKIQTTYTITHHVIPNTYLLDKRQKATTATWQGPKHLKSTKGLQMRRPFTSSQCFNRRNYKPNLSQWHHLIMGASHKSHTATSLSVLQGNSSRRSALQKQLEFQGSLQTHIWSTAEVHILLYQCLSI